MMVFAGGLHPISSATVVDGTGDEPLLTDGPYLESREYLGGFWVIEADDLDEALALGQGGLGRLLARGRGAAVPSEGPSDRSLSPDRPGDELAGPIGPGSSLDAGLPRGARARSSVR